MACYSSSLGVVLGLPCPPSADDGLLSTPLQWHCSVLSPPPPYTCPFCLQGPVGHLGTASLCHPCFKSMGSWKSVPNRAALWDNYHHGDCLILSVYCSSIGFLPSSVCREWSLVHLFGGVSQGRASTRNEQANVPRRNEAILALPVATWVTLGKPLSFMWNHTMKSTCYED